MLDHNCALRRITARLPWVHGNQDYGSALSDDVLKNPKWKWSFTLFLITQRAVGADSKMHHVSVQFSKKNRICIQWPVKMPNRVASLPLMRLWGSSSDLSASLDPQWSDTDAFVLQLVWAGRDMCREARDREREREGECELLILPCLRQDGVWLFLSSATFPGEGC